MDVDVDIRHRCLYLEERNRRLEARKQWNVQQRVCHDACLHQLNHLRGQFLAGHLHPVELSGQDDQYLFELGLKLRFGAETDEVCSAMSELSQSVVFDFRPQTLIQRKTLIVPYPWSQSST